MGQGRRGRARPLLVLVPGLLLLAGCGGSDSPPAVRPPASTSPTTPASSPMTSPTGPSSPSSPSSATAAPTVHPRVRVEPAKAIRDGQVVSVTASGFSPGLTLIVVQCADKGQQTGAGDCNLAGSVPVQTDGSGRVTTGLQVTKGPFGANQSVCSDQQPCLVSVTEATLNPTEEADATISFS